MRDENRKNEWKYARKRINILKWTSIAGELKDEDISKPVHYFANNPHWNSYAAQPNKTKNKGHRRYRSHNYQPNKNWKETDQRQIDEFEGQLEELGDD